MKTLISCAMLGFLPAMAAEHHVATNGTNGASGALSAPWATIQYALDQAAAGDTVWVRGGVYPERVVFNASGISLRAYADEVPAIDGGSFTVGSGWDALLDLNGQSNLLVDGLELRNLRTALRNRNPIGLLVRGGSKNVRLSNLKIHDIETNYTGRNGGDAFGLAVYGDSESSSVSNLLIDAVEIYNCRLGSSESMALNGNVEFFTVQNCVVHDNNNIGIVFIGYEETCPVPALDRARDGLCIGNSVYHIRTTGNPAYGTDRSADGIYVDGGTRIVIERNIVHDSDIGLEIASEHGGRATSFIMLRNNLVYSNYTGGIFVGGYDKDRGSAENCTVIGNTLFHNDTGKGYSGEILLQMHVTNCVFENNLVVPLANSGGDAVFVGGIGGSGSTPGNTRFNRNLYYSSVANPDKHLWTWGSSEHYGIGNWRSTGQDANAVYNLNPRFANPAAGNFSIGADSPAVGKGTNRTDCGLFDLGGHPRIHGGAVDIGAYEYYPYTTNGTPHAWLDRHGLAGTNTYAAADWGDVDLDGMAAWQEYQAGTDPSDGGSVFKFIGIDPVAGIAWLGGTNDANMSFQVWRSTNLVDPVAWVLAANRPRQNGTNTWSDPSMETTASLFYRITAPARP